MIADTYQYPVAVFDDQGQSVFRNSALTALLTAEQQLQSSDRTWQLVYTNACRIVADSINIRKGVSTVISVHQRSFVILGSLLHQTSGTVYGVTVNLAEVTSRASETGLIGSGTHNSNAGCVDSGDDAYSSWMQRRDDARARMQRLSPRETEVVARVSAGLPSKSIARELEISVKPIEKHRANAVRKLGVQSTPEMVGIAVLADMVKETTTVVAPSGMAPHGSTPLTQTRFVSGNSGVRRCVH